MLSKWAEVRKVTVKTSLVTGKPAVKSAKVSRQGTKRNVAVTFTVPKSCDGTDWQRKFPNLIMAAILV